MLRPYLMIAPLILLLATACKKYQGPSPLTFKLKLVSGSGQTDTIGRNLANQIAVTATQGGHAVRDGYLRFETISCDNTPQYTDVSIATNPTQPYSSYTYTWQLNMTVGAQTLKIILLDSVKEAKDSVTLPATGLPTKAGWHTSGCLPISRSCIGFAQLPAGRIFTALNQPDYPYYSDDDGATWHQLSNFPAKGLIQSLSATPQNEIFINIPNTGIYYSADKGQTWQQRSIGLPNNTYDDLRCTASGVLISRAYTGPGPYYSTDKGVTWQLADATGIIGPGPAGDNSSDAQSMSDGTILAFFNGVLTKSRTSGASWRTVFTANYHTYSMLVDSNNYIFLGGAATPYNNAGIYLSKDTGATWTQPYTGAELAGPDKSVSQLSVKNGYYYFYATENNILKQTRDLINYSVVGPPISNNGGRYSYRYLVTNSNHFILSVEFQGLFYQTP